MKRRTFLGSLVALPAALRAGMVAKPLPFVKPELVTTFDARLFYDTVAKQIEAIENGLQTRTEYERT